jgi:predicted AAA+ superfamily ATPase
MDIKEKIYNLLVNKKSLFLIGPTDSGKSVFAKNELLLFLQSKGLSACYFSDCDHLPDSKIAGDVAIIDEVEILQDRVF